MADQFATALQNIDITKFPVWQEISDRLREPRLFALDPDLASFDGRDGQFSGLADVMLTYKGDFIGVLDESVTLPATLYGTITMGQPLVTRIEVSFS